jgi:hypothetical protein
MMHPNWKPVFSRQIPRLQFWNVQWYITLATSPQLEQVWNLVEKSHTSNRVGVQMDS